MYEYLKYERENGVAKIILNRPEVYNALNDGITYELQDVIKKISRDELVRVVILTGEGKAFCAGQDLKATSGEEKRALLASLHKRYNPIIRGIRNLPKPIICRLNGVAAGAGCSLALACDLIVAAEEAILTEVFINIGLVLDSGSSYFLPRAVGSAKAFELATMGSKIDGKKAFELGLVNKAVPAAQLDEAVKGYTAYYAQAPTKAVGLIKKMLHKSWAFTLDEMLDYEAYCQEIAGSTRDYTEGVSAFLEKRKAEFTGR